MATRSWRPGRQTPKVKDGAVQKKNRSARYAKEYAERAGSAQIPIVFEPAARGYRHAVTETELRAFVELIPDWASHSVGVRCLVLGDGTDDCFGWHDGGILCISAWQGFEQRWPREFFDEHRGVLEKLMVPWDELGRGDALVKFTRETARAFQLLHVFLHELGHHADRMQTKARTHSPRGEHYAETFALETADRMWSAFARRFPCD